jgi:signal transduction histidine kinase
MRTCLQVALLIALTWTVAVAAPDDFGSPTEAEALVAKAIAHIDEVGPAKAYQDFTNKERAFVDRDLYVVVYDLDGRVLAHGQHARMVGQNLMGTRDPDGKPWIKERVDLARSKGKFWHTYRFTDPITKKTMNKSSYCERVEGTVVCVGIYKRQPEP